MNQRKLAGLFVCSLVVYSYGNGFLPLMPLYAQRLGATSETAGYYVGFSYLLLAIGTFVGGWLSDAAPSRRALLAGSGILAFPLTWLLGRVETFGQLVVVNGAQWLVIGVCLAVIGAIAGREASPKERGRVFGILATTISLGGLIGGLVVGRMADAWGYAFTLSVLSLVMLIIPVAALAMGRESAVERRATIGTGARGAVPLVSGGLVLLVAAEVLTMVSNGEGNLGRSLQMNVAAFNGTAITTTAAVGGLAALPIPFLLGWLSDRAGRKAIIAACPLFGVASLLFLLFSRSLWQFCLVSIFNSLMTVSVSIGPAIVADVVRRERVGTAISLFQSAVWVGMIIGYSSSGIAFQRLGVPIGLAAGAVVALLAIPLFLAISSSAAARREAEVSPAP